MCCTVHHLLVNLICGLLFKHVSENDLLFMIYIQLERLWIQVMRRVITI